MNRECAMTTAAVTVTPIAWWKEPTKDQWYAYVAAWAGWTLDAFDFTAFLLIIAPIAKEFDVPVPEVAAVLTITLWMRLFGATASGWLADRIGRKTPLMISIAWYSVCNFLAGLAPSFFLLFLFRALLGIGMGAEWPAGAALAMETWPMRSRGFMGAVMQGSWGIGFLLSSAIYGLFYNYIGWRGLLMIGIAPAPADHLYPAIRQRTGDLGREPTSAEGAKPPSAGTTILDLQARDAGKHAHYLPNDGERVRHLLCELRPIRDPSAARPPSQSGPGRVADRACQHVFLSLFAVLGLVGGTHRPALGDHHPGGARGSDRVPLSADPGLHVDRARICVAGGVCVRRDAGSMPGLSLGAVSDRSARHGGRLLFPPGGNLGRADLATTHFIRDQ